MSICLYPAHVVEKHMAAVMADPGLAARKNQPNFLHYVLYAIEKCTNFGGPQAWQFAQTAATSDGSMLDAPPHGLIGLRSALNHGMAARFAANDAADLAAAADEERDTEKKKVDWFDWFLAGFL